MTQDNLSWLVKSSGRILGPFPTSKIAELLRTREISVLDEISPSMRRWQTIQYHDEFREVVDGLRKASLSERTEASWTPGSSTTSLTQTLTDHSGGELTDELTGSMEGFTNTAKEIVVHDVPEQVQSPQNPASGRFQPQQGQSTAIQRQVEKTTRGLWLTTILILLAAAAFIVHKRMNSGGFESRSVSNLKQAVIGLVQVGHYAEALKEMRNHFGDPAQAGDLAIYYGSLLIQVEGQTVTGRRALNSVLSAHRADAKQAYTGLGVADLIDGQLDSAQENFDHALSLDVDYVPAVVNTAAVSLQKGDYQNAKRQALMALKLSPQQGEALLMLAEAQLYLFKSNGNVSELSQVGKMISDFRAHQWDYASELGFYDLYFSFLRRDHGLEAQLQKYLDIDPELTQDHRHNVFIYKGRAQWKILARFCEQMAEKMNDGARVSAFLASCYAHEGRWDTARSAIEKSVHEQPKDPLVQAWYSYVLRESGDGDQASVVLGRATEFDRRGDFILPALMQARFCQKAGLVECARDNWRRLYERDLEYLPAVAGLAWVQVQMNSRGEANKLLSKGFRLSPDYIPLLELRQRGETEGWYAVAN